MKLLLKNEWSDLFHWHLSWKYYTHRFWCCKPLRVALPYQKSNRPSLVVILCVWILSKGLRLGIPLISPNENSQQINQFETNKLPLGSFMYVWCLSVGVLLHRLLRECVEAQSPPRVRVWNSHKPNGVPLGFFLPSSRECVQWVPSIPAYWKAKDFVR